VQNRAALAVATRVLQFSQGHVSSTAVRFDRGRKFVSKLLLAAPGGLRHPLEIQMNCSLASSCTKPSRCAAVVPFAKRLLLVVAIALVAGFAAHAQNPEVQQKLAAAKQAAAQNKQQLRQYQWTETTQLTLKGDPKPPSEKLCQYGPDGQIQKTPIGAPPQEPSGGRLKQRIVEKKKAEITDYMGDVKTILGMYIPPDPQKMQQAFQAGKVSFNPVGGVVNLIFSDYAQPGDRMILAFDTATKKIISLTINTYMGQAKDAVTLQVQMASLPGGPNYAQQTILNASAKQLVVTTTNSNYQKLGG
jgi:hypothetical protein